MPTSDVLLSRSSHLLIAFGNAQKLLECDPEKVLPSMARYASDNECMFQNTVDGAIPPLSPYLLGITATIAASRPVKAEASPKLNTKRKVLELVRASVGYIIQISRIGDMLKRSQHAYTGSLTAFVRSIKSKL